MVCFWCTLRFSYGHTIVDRVNKILRSQRCSLCGKLKRFKIICDSFFGKSNYSCSKNILVNIYLHFEKYLNVLNLRLAIQICKFISI